MHSSWTLKWIRPEAAQPLQLSKTSRIAAICSDTQVLCTTAVTCTDSICWLTPPLVSAEAAETVINFLLQQLKNSFLTRAVNSCSCCSTRPKMIVDCRVA